MKTGAPAEIISELSQRPDKLSFTGGEKMCNRDKLVFLTGKHSASWHNSLKKHFQKKVWRVEEEELVFTKS